MKVNYLKIFKNKSFMAGTFAYGAIELPFYAWISIAPIILFEKSKVSNLFSNDSILSTLWLI